MTKWRVIPDFDWKWREVTGQIALEPVDLEVGWWFFFGGGGDVLLVLPGN
jgi:hypothetical protein